METRTNIVHALVGNRGTGKTDFLKLLLRSSNQPKKLIVDTFDSPVWHNLQAHDYPNGINEPIGLIDQSNFGLWKSGTYRVFNSDTDLLMEDIQRDVFNSLIIFEDATKYIGSTLTKNVKNFILDSKQKNLDLVFVFHSLKDLPSDLIRVMDYLTLGKTGDKWQNVKNKYPDSVEEAHQQVMASKSKYEKITLQISS